MTRLNDSNRFPGPNGQVNENLQNALEARLKGLSGQALKSKNPLEWELLQGKPYLAGFIGCNESKAEELIQNGRIIPYPYNGTDCFLIKDAVKLINEDPEINLISWKSFKDKKYTPDDPVIHWVKFKWNLESHILLKYLFQKKTFYAFLKPELWRSNKKIGSALIRLINKNLKSQRNEKN
jgi:hypothetical protein